MTQPGRIDPGTPGGADADAAWALDADEVLARLKVDPQRGLGAAEAERRRSVSGPNRLSATQKRHILSILVAQFRSVVVLLLASVGVLAFLFSEFVEGIAIFVVLIINSAIGFVTEWRAERSMDMLRAMTQVDCILLRDGVATRMAAEAIVPGDIVLLDAGDIVPADLRLTESAKLKADESMLTGESLTVRKHVGTLAADNSVLERHNMVFSGTAITRGSGKGIAVATGMQTEFGKIYRQVSTAEAHQTPLEKRLDALGERLVWAVIVMAVIMAAVGVIAGRDTFLAIEVAIALSVAAIPEGLPIVATVALARGMWRMARRNALITKLSAVETLGATSIIMTDKTGTLTENRMAVSKILLADASVKVTGAEDAAAAVFQVDNHDLTNGVAQTLDELLRVAVLCSNASLERLSAGTRQGVGDATELALLRSASGRGIWRATELDRYPERREEPFDPDSKLMATIHAAGDEELVAVKGAAESVIPLCTTVRTPDGDRSLETGDRERWLQSVERLAQRGLRTIAFAAKNGADIATRPYSDLVLLGIAGLEDPARAGVENAIARCQDAGILVVMLTGDHAATARNIGIEVGVIDADADNALFADGREVDALLNRGAQDELLATRIFSRVTPEHKLKLIALYQSAGHVVAMTGDGVNDAPALRKADIGIAMGVRGTAVAKEASAMVLQDDEFGTIVAAVEHGRAIFENLRKFVVYLLSCNISEVLVVGLATIAGAPLPLLPLQILFLNLVTDVFPALALGVGPGSPALMRKPPRPVGEGILTRSHWIRIGIHGGVIAASVLAAMAIASFVLDYDTKRAVTVSFCTLALAQMWHVFNMRDSMRRVIDNEITRNVWIWLALILCLLLVIAAVYVPLLADVLSLTDPGPAGWLVIAGASLVPLLLGPLVRLILGGDRSAGARATRAIP